jgi:O-antigen/teichoic acid export membrane protein
MSKKKISIGVFLGGLSIAASSLSGLIIYPLLLKNLSKEVAGLWFLYTSLTIIISLGQAGLAPIVMRRAAAAITDGRNTVLADFYALIIRSYFIVSIIVLIICILLYSLYVHWVLIESPALFVDGLVAWVFFVAGNLVNINCSKNFYIINGFGEVGWDKLSQILVTVITITGYFVALYLGFGLKGLSVIFFIASLFNALSSKVMLSIFVPRSMLSEKGVTTINHIKNMFKDGGEILVLNLVAILVINKDVFLVERFYGLSELTMFSALSRIQGIVISVSLLIPQMIFPFLSKSFVTGNYLHAMKMYLQGVLFSMAVGLLLSIIVYFLAEILIPLWLGRGNYLGNQIFFLLLLMGLLSINHSAHASAVISTGEKSFIWPAIINALLSVPFAIIGINYFGIEGMIIGNLLATLIPSIYVVNYSIRYFRRLVKKSNINSFE